MVDKLTVPNYLSLYKKMKFTLSILTIALFLGSCRNTKNASNDFKTETIVSILHGTSYGNCRGYCIKEEFYTANNVVCDEISRDTARYPKKTTINGYTPEEFSTLTKTVDFSKWAQMEERIGCPDCTDRGSEYIEITTLTTSKRVVFDAYKDSLAGFDELLSLLRAGRKKMEKPEKVEMKMEKITYDR